MTAKSMEAAVIRTPLVAAASVAVAEVEASPSVVEPEVAEVSVVVLETTGVPQLMIEESVEDGTNE